jgi:hypothetical protein
MSTNKKTLIDGDFQVGSAHFYVDVINNRVGLNQTNPTSSLDVNGNAFIGTDMTVASNVTVGSNVIAQKFTGSASGLTSVPADQISGVIPVANGGTGTTATTGTGSLVKSDNPTFTGTVTAETFSGSGASLTNIPMGQATGTLAVANGGTGVTTSTGTGNTVLSASPTLTGAVTAETANFSSNVSASNVYAGYDTDMTSYLGRAAVGFSGISDKATFAHIDVNSTNNYALKQSATGKTYVNSATSKSTIFSINDSEQARINTTGLGVGTNNPQFKLDVHGTANVGVLTCTSVSGDGSGLTNISGYSWPTHANGNDIYYTTGNVGIGTATPGNTFEVAGTASVAILKSAASAATSTYNFILNGPRPGTTSGGAVHFINGSTRTGDGDVSTYTIRNDSGKLRLGKASYNTLIEGNVGIGTTIPLRKFHVVSGVGDTSTDWISGVFGGSGDYPRVVLGSLFTTACIGSHNSALNAWADLYLNNPTFPVVVKTTGNVGIGVTDPDSKLEVRGNIRASSSDTNHGMFIDAGGTILRDYGGNGAGLHFTANQIFPTNYLGAYSAGGIDLGSPTYRWNNVYTEALNASGTITATSFSGIQVSDVPTLNQNTTGQAGTIANQANSATIEATTADTANKIALRNGSGDILARLFRSDYQNQSDCGPAIAFRNSTTDNYIRFCSDMGAVRSRIGCAALAGTASQNFYANTIYIGNSTSKGLRSVSGNYGTVQTTGGGSGGWEGYSIDGRYVFMSADSNSCGIYNDLDNEWMIYCYRNSYTKLYFNGSEKLETINTGVTIKGNGKTTGSFEADGRIYADNGCHVRGDWLRVNGVNGLYFESYGGGWHMNDSSWVKSYNGKGVYTTGAFYTDGNRSVIRGDSPTLYFRDTNNNSAMWHCNSNLMYLLRGGNDTESWTTVGGAWPFICNLTNNKIDCGGVLTARSYVGIGTTGPVVPLHITLSGGAMSYNTRSYFKYGSSGVTGNSGGFSGISIYATGNIITGNYIVAHAGTVSSSDIRIKKYITDIDDGAALETLRLLKPKQYRYKDVVAQGRDPVWGFIAQEVRDVLPYATLLRSECIPNIYELANVSQSNVITFTKYTTSSLNNDRSKIRLVGVDGKEVKVKIVEVIDDHTIRVDENLDEHTGYVNEDGNLEYSGPSFNTLTPEEYEALEDKSGYSLEDGAYVKTDIVKQIFVYGEEVDDFHVLKKDAIWTVATAALQEVDRQQQADKVRISELEAKVENLQTHLSTSEQKYQDLLERVVALESV